MPVQQQKTPVQIHAPAEAQPKSELLDQVIEATERARYSVDDIQFMAKRAAQSRLFGMDEAQSFTLMMICEAEGRHPIEALRRYDIIDNKPAMKAVAMQADFQRRGGRIVWIERTAEACEGVFTHPIYQPEPLRIRTTLKELVDQGVAVGRDGKLKANYQRSPRAMLHARVVSEGVRAIDPEIVVGIYTPEEIMDFDDRPQPEAPRPTTAPAVVPAPEVPASAARDGLREWLKRRCIETNDALAAACSIEGVEPWKPIANYWQPVNHLITARLERGDLKLEQVEKAGGKRSNGRMEDTLASEWQRDAAALKAEVDAYLGAKLEEACKSLDGGMLPEGE